MKEYKNYSYLNMADERRARTTKKGSFLELLLVWILPFIVINLLILYIVTAQPNFTVNIEDPGDYKTAVVNIAVKSLFPRKEVVATFNDEPLELEKLSGKTYTATVAANGVLSVTVTNKNGMSKTVYENISNIDDTPPRITEDDSASGYISVYVEDTQSGIDYDSVYALDTDGKRILPSLVDEGEGLLVFNFDTPSIEIHVCDKTGYEALADYNVTVEYFDPLNPDASAATTETGADANANDETVISIN